VPARQELAPSPLESVVSMPRLGLRAYKGRALVSRDPRIAPLARHQERRRLHLHRPAASRAFVRPTRHHQASQAQRRCLPVREAETLGDLRWCCRWINAQPYVPSPLCSRASGSRSREAPPARARAPSLQQLAGASTAAGRQLPIRRSRNTDCKSKATTSITASS